MTDHRPIRKIGCIGEVMIELVAREKKQADVNIAGDTYNTAVYLARLLNGTEVSVSYITALGTDRFSDRIVAHMQESGVGSEHVERRSDRTAGLYAIDTDETGERSFTYWRSASAARTLFAPPCGIGLDILEQFDLLYLSGITLAILPPSTRQSLLAALDQFRADGGRVAYDSNHRPRLWESEDVARAINTRMWENCDIALPSADDESVIFGGQTEEHIIQRFQSYELPVGALKRGAKGPLALGPEEVHLKFAPAENVIDTTAAGDSFNAGFLTELAKGNSLEEALTTGHEIASKVIQKRGAIVEI